MDRQPVSDLMTSVMQKIREMVDVNTIVGQPINTPDGTTIVPVSKVSFGYGAAGADVPKDGSVTFGGGSGAGVNIVPVAFLIIQAGEVKLLPVTPPAGSSVDRAIEMLPGIIDKIGGMIKKGKDKESEEE